MDINQFEIKLRELKSQLIARASRTHKHIFEKQHPVSPNFNEQVKETENDSLVLLLDREGQVEIAQINKALQRLETGDFGVCQSCGNAIPEERLLAIPYAAKCIGCANAA